MTGCSEQIHGREGAFQTGSVGTSTCPSPSHIHRVVFVVVFIAVGFSLFPFHVNSLGCGVAPVQRLKKEVTVELLCSR